MTLIGMEYLKNQETKRHNLATEKAADDDRASKLAIANADRQSHESIASAERASKENIAHKDRASKEMIASLDRTSKETIAKLDRTSKQVIADKDRASKFEIADLDRDAATARVFEQGRAAFSVQLQKNASDKKLLDDKQEWESKEREKDRKATRDLAGAKFLGDIVTTGMRTRGLSSYS